MTTSTRYLQISGRFIRTVYSPGGRFLTTIMGFFAGAPAAPDPVPEKSLSLLVSQVYDIMDTGFLRVLLNPGRFFEARMQDEPSLKVPALIALAIGLIGAVSAALAANLVIGILPADMQAFGMIGVAFAVVGGVIGGFLTWLIFGVVFYGISMVFKGTGSFKRTLEFTGYGSLPQVFGGIIGTIFTYLLISNLTIPRATSPEEIAAVAENLTSIMVTNPLAQIAGLVGILFMIWSANIWIFGMKYARNLSTRDAVLTVGIPVGLYILYTLITLAGWL